MRLEQLYIFKKIAESSSIRMASEHLYVTPQYASKAMIQLEEELNTKLYVRSRTGIELTEDGKKAYELILPIIESIDDFKNSFGVKGDSRAEYDAPVYVVCCAVMEALVSGSINQLILTKFQNTPVQIDKRGSSEIKEAFPALLTGEDRPDIIIVNSDRKECERIRNTYGVEYQIYSIFRDELCLQVPKNDPLAKLSFIPMSTLTDLPMILFSGTPKKKTESEILLEEMGYPLKNVSRTANLETTSLTAFNLHKYCFVGFPSVEFRPLPNVEYIPLEKPLYTEYIIMLKRDRVNRLFSKALIDVLDSYFNLNEI